MVDVNLIPKVMFNNGQRCPFIGLGTFEGESPCGKMQQVVMDAIGMGYRLFDCALLHKNENEIGEGICEKIKDCTVTREDLYITSKLWNTFHRPDMVEDAFKISLEDLGLNYLDLYLLQSPMAWKECAGLHPKGNEGKILYSRASFTQAWTEMEKIQESGRARSIGISNFNSKQIVKLLQKARVMPVVNQVEVHPYFTNKNIKKFCESIGIVLQALSPLGSPNRPWKREDEPVLMDDNDVKCIADKYGKTPANVLLRYLYQRGIVSVPKATDGTHLSSNINIWDFCLNEADIQILNCKDVKVRYCHFNWVRDHPDYPFHDPY